MNDECVRCHRTMHTDDGCDPTDLCHNCAHERVEELEAQVQTLREALEFYADGQNYQDGGAKALDALAATEPKEGK